jgi:sortase A
VLSKILGGVGRVMIALGVLLLAFVAFQLWGTGYQTDQAQARLDREFQDQLAAARSDVPTSPTVSTPSTSTSTTEAPTTTGSPGTTAVPDGSTTSSTSTTRRPGEPPPKGDPNDPRVAQADALTFRQGQAVGRITIPKIGTDFVMVEGVDLSLLSEGPGHFPNTPVPGQAGNAALAGHRVTYKAPFNRIDELAPGDQIGIETVQGRFTYEVLPQEAPGGGTQGWYLVSPADLSILDDHGDNRLTLMACHPKYDLSQRIIVQARLVDNPAPSSPRLEGDYRLPDEADELARTGTTGAVLVSGDPAARLPAVLFSLAALAVALLAWFVGRRWKRWPAYLIASPLVIILLWFAFEYINRSLPGAY